MPYLDAVKTVYLHHNGLLLSNVCDAVAKALIRVKEPNDGLPEVECWRLQCNAQLMFETVLEEESHDNGEAIEALGPVFRYIKSQEHRRVPVLDYLCITIDVPFPLCVLLTEEFMHAFERVQQV